MTDQFRTHDALFFAKERVGRLSHTHTTGIQELKTNSDWNIQSNQATYPFYIIRQVGGYEIRSMRQFRSSMGLCLTARIENLSVEKKDVMNYFTTVHYIFEINKVIYYSC